jgi:Domain of unknown function (DUF4276)
VHIELQVKEPSAEEVLRCILPRLIGDKVSYRIINYGGKRRMLQRLPKRLQAYAKRLREGEKLRLVVLLDRDDDDCRELKGCLESMARAAGLSTKTAPHGDGSFFVVNRLAIEELEAWFLGDGDAIRAAFPRIGRYEAQASYRNPDQVRGGTWGRPFTVF